VHPIFSFFFQVLLQPTEITFTSKASRKNGTQAETRLARGLKQSRWWWRWVSQPLRDFIEITSIGTQQGMDDIEYQDIINIKYQYHGYYCTNIQKVSSISIFKIFK